MMKLRPLMAIHTRHAPIQNGQTHQIACIMNFSLFINSALHFIAGQIFTKIVFFIYFTADKTPTGFPIITQSPQTRVVEIGHTAVMQCRSTGNPTPKIFWLKDSVRLDMSNSRYSLIDGKFCSLNTFNSRFNRLETQNCTDLVNSGLPPPVMYQT